MDLDKLLGARAATASGMPESDVPLPGGIGTVRVRALTRREVGEVKEADGSLEIECAMLSFALVDPAMTPDQVAAWQAVALAGELEPVVQRVQEMSALLAGSSKSAVSGDGGGPRS